MKWHVGSEYEFVSNKVSTTILSIYQLLWEMHLFCECVESSWGSDWGPWGYVWAAWPPLMHVRLNELADWVWVRIWGQGNMILTTFEVARGNAPIFKVF